MPPHLKKKTVACLAVDRDSLASHLVNLVVDLQPKAKEFIAHLLDTLLEELEESLLAGRGDEIFRLRQVVVAFVISDPDGRGRGSESVEELCHATVVCHDGLHNGTEGLDVSVAHGSWGSRLP